MNDYSPKERALLDAARKGWGPSESLVRDVRDGVPERLQADPDLGLAAPGPMDAALSVGRFAALKAFARSPWATVSGLAIVGLCSVVGAVFVQERTPSPPAVTPSTLAAAPTQTAFAVTEPALKVEPPEPKLDTTSPPPVETVTLDSLPEAPAAPPSKAKSSAAPSTPNRANTEHPEAATNADSIAEEVALVRTARKALRDGQPAQALASLSNHAARFPRGALREERMTLQVLSLCATGDIAQARRVRAELERVAPSSSHLERLSCAAP